MWRIKTRNKTHLFSSNFEGLLIEKGIYAASGRDKTRRTHQSSRKREKNFPEPKYHFLDLYSPTCHIIDYSEVVFRRYSMSSQTVEAFAQRVWPQFMDISGKTKISQKNICGSGNQTGRYVTRTGRSQFSNSWDRRKTYDF